MVIRGSRYCHITVPDIPDTAPRLLPVYRTGLPSLNPQISLYVNDGMRVTTIPDVPVYQADNCHITLATGRQLGYSGYIPDRARHYTIHERLITMIESNELNWQLVTEYKMEHELNELTAKQWAKYRKEHDLIVKNINGKYYVREMIEADYIVTEETGSEVTTELPLTKPSVVTFGDFSSSLAVINNSTSGHIAVSNTTFNTGTLAGEAELFVSQLGAFTDFLTNAETMLEQRKVQLEEQTRIKREALNNTQLQVENIRQRALLAQRKNIAVTVENQDIDNEMDKVINLGKQLHTTLSGLQE